MIYEVAIEDEDGRSSDVLDRFLVDSASFSDAVKSAKKYCDKSWNGVDVRITSITEVGQPVNKSA
jgi:hypothetical protein